jgi:preprotein translocase subunit SecF
MMLIDSAVNQTLTRSINTSLTTVLPLVAIVVFGGQTLKFFALALIIGFLSGAYSSIFIASTTCWPSGENAVVRLMKPIDTDDSRATLPSDQLPEAPQ